VVDRPHTAQVEEVFEACGGVPGIEAAYLRAEVITDSALFALLENPAS
jgi:hypothetical protein